MTTDPIWDVAVRKPLRHGDSDFLLDVAFTSRARRIVLFGPSGSGKTQTLRMIAGISMPEQGRIAVAGHTLLDTAARIRLTPQQRAIGLVFQDYALFPHLTVRQNIAFARKGSLRNPSTRFTDPVIDRWIETLGLQRVAEHYPAQISGGQRQRTALARALAREPVALLLDEPFAALDKSLRSRLRDELLEVQQSLALPLLLITHDDDDVRALAEDVISVAEGRVQGRGATPAEATSRT